MKTNWFVAIYFACCIYSIFGEIMIRNNGQTQLIVFALPSNGQAWQKNKTACKPSENIYFDEKANKNRLKSKQIESKRLEPKRAENKKLCLHNTYVIRLGIPGFGAWWRLRWL